MQQDTVKRMFVFLWRKYSSFMGYRGEKSPQQLLMCLGLQLLLSITTDTEAEPCVLVNFPYEIESNIYDTQIVLRRVRHLTAEMKSMKNDGDVNGFVVVISDLLSNI